VSHLSYGADNGTLSFRWIRGTWFVELTERFKSRPVDVYGVPALRGAAARWLEQNDEAPLAAERAAKQWHKAGEYRKAAAAYSRSALSESVLRNTADARRLDGISRTLEARAGVLGMSPG